MLSFTSGLLRVFTTRARKEHLLNVKYHYVGIYSDFTLFTRQISSDLSSPLAKNYTAIRYGLLPI